MKILDCEHGAPIDGVRLVLTENEVCGLVGALQGVWRDNSWVDCIYSDGDVGECFVTVGGYGSEVDDF